jgi:NADH-quinone oxidoreductase subunit L
MALQGGAAIVAFWGISLAGFRYGGNRRLDRIAESECQPEPLTAFCLHGWYLDSLYEFLIIRPFKQLATILWERVDEGVIDDSLDRFATLLGRTGRLLGSLGEGKVSAYILSMAIGAALIIAYMAWVAII